MYVESIKDEKRNELVFPRNLVIMVAKEKVVYVGQETRRNINFLEIWNYGFWNREREREGEELQCGGIVT